MDSRYPIGKFEHGDKITDELMQKWISQIEELPITVREAVSDLDNDKLNTPYRTGGWTIRQVIHDLADSHMNAYIRFKLALTEDTPVIKPYDEARWATLPDSDLPIEISLSLLESLHQRWVYLLRQLTPTEKERIFIHPENGNVTLAENIGIYAWHGQHHVAHITSLRNRMGW